MERTIGQLTIPFILDTGDFATDFIIEDEDFAVNGLLLANALDHIAGAQVQPDRVTAVGHFEMETLDFRKCSLETVLLFIDFSLGGIDSSLER